MFQRGLFMGILLLIFVQCGDDHFVARTSRIVVTPIIPNTADGSIEGKTDTTPATVHLGGVALNSSATAMFRLENPANKTAIVDSVQLVKTQGTGVFTIVRVPDEVKPAADTIIEARVIIEYSPKNEWTDLNDNNQPDSSEIDMATFVIRSSETDAESSEIEIKVDGFGVDRGSPEIQVCYNGYCGPDIQQDCAGGVCILSQPLEFGNIGLGSIGQQIITVKNTATCLFPEEGTICDHPELCQLIIDQDSQYYDIGLGFESGTNADNRFKPKVSLNVPTTIVQDHFESNNCGQSSYLQIPMEYHAPVDPTEDTATFIIESNDIESPIIKIPITATARNAPIAICNFREQDTQNPSAPWTDPESIEPLQRVYLDGSNSYDPSDPDDASLIEHYLWQVINYPPGTNPSDFDPEGNDSRYYNFFVPLAGPYTVKLTVTNAENITSGDTNDSICEFQVIPGSRFHLQLVWDDPTNDQDLHLLFLDESTLICNSRWDCYWENQEPIWFADYPDANPHLDRDDTEGKGPENINIDEPQPGRYRILVHYFDDRNSGSPAPTENTVRLFIDELQVAQYKRVLSYKKDLWAVADIIWVGNPSDPVYYIDPMPTDVDGQYGYLCTGFTCLVPGNSCEFNN